jgi:ferredoxin
LAKEREKGKERRKKSFDSFFFFLFEQKGGIFSFSFFLFYSTVFINLLLLLFMATYKVRLLNESKSLDVVIPCAGDQFILEAAEENNIELPYSCRAGSCSTCLGKVSAGTLEQPDQTFLDEDQLGQGFVLTCVAYPTSDVTVLTHEEENLY